MVSAARLSSRQRNVLPNTEDLLVVLGEQEARWRQRTPWLLPLAFVAGFLVKRVRPGRKLWHLARGMMLVGNWLEQRDPVYRKPE